MDNKTQFVDVFKRGITHFNNCWAKIKPFIMNKQQPFFMGIPSLLHGSLGTLICLWLVVSLLLFFLLVFMEHILGWRVCMSSKEFAGPYS